MLDIADLVTAYGKIEALKGVSLRVERGTITCLLGPNGAGKTTLMMSIAAILKPRRGSIRLGATNWSACRPRKIVAQGRGARAGEPARLPADERARKPVCRRLPAPDKADVEADIERMYARFPAP